MALLALLLLPKTLQLLANAALTQAVTDYTTVNSSAAGLEGIIAEIGNVTAGDQTNLSTMRS